MVGDVAGHADDMLGPGAVLGEDREDVAQRLRELAVQRVFGRSFLLVPADHAGGEDHPAARGDAVGIALGPRPAGREQDLHARSSFSKIAGDDLPLHLARAFVDAQRADLAVELLDLGAAGDAEPAVHLHRLVDHLLRALGGVELGHGRGAAVVGPPTSCCQAAR